MRQSVCFAIMIAVTWSAALLAWAGGGWVYDRLRGPPQDFVTARPMDYVVRPGETFKYTYRSTKHRDCEMHLVRRLWRLDSEGARTGESIVADLGTNAGPRGQAPVGSNIEQNATLVVPIDAPPGRYEYEPEITRRCTPFVGRKWRIQQEAIPLVVE